MCNSTDKPLFEHGCCQTKGFETDKFTVQVWDCPDGCEDGVRLLRFRECPKKPTKDVPSSREMWVVTTDKDMSAELIWRIIRQRWAVEPNGFHQLKTYYHADHCFCKCAIEQFFLAALIAFNLREAYLFRLRVRTAGLASQDVI